MPPGLSITVTPDLPKGLYPVFPPLDAVGSNKNTSTTKTIRIKVNRQYIPYMFNICQHIGFRIRWAMNLHKLWIPGFGVFGFEILPVSESLEPESLISCMKNI